VIAKVLGHPNLIDWDIESGASIEVESESQLHRVSSPVASEGGKSAWITMSP
jgi:hypothetical protein